MEILCSSDCLAESKTFERSVEFFSLQMLNISGGYRGWVTQEILQTALVAAPSVRNAATLVGVERRSMRWCGRMGSISRSRIK
jgi:hypothetical protein